MELTGEKVIHGSQTRVWAALHDPSILRQAIPGMQTLNKVAGDRYDVTAALKVGPMRPSFTATIEVYNEDRPSGYSLRGLASSPGSGAVAGNAHIALAAIDGQTTNLAYHITADLDGKLAALEGVLIEATGRTLAEEFFSRLQTLLDGELVGPVPDHPPRDAVDPPGPIRDDEKGDVATLTRPKARTAPRATPAEPADRDAPQPSARNGNGEANAARAPSFAQFSNSSSGSERPAIVDATTATGSGLWRWLGVLVGLLMIAALLNDSF